MMKLGLIGNPLGHSKSPQIHKFLTGTDYSLWPLEPQELDAFFSARDFDGINVTIPYKRSVLKYLDSLDLSAQRTGAVNTIVNRSGKLTGYNTDCAGLMVLIKELLGSGNAPEHAPLAGINAAILGTGGAARAAAAAVAELGGKAAAVSRAPSAKDPVPGAETISYTQLYSRAGEFTLLINATPCGMSPDLDGMPADENGALLDLGRLPHLKAVVDVIANPLRTRLVFEAQKRGLKTAGGLKMLVAQAFAAEEIFTGRTLDPSLIESCTAELIRQQQNIVLTGMPSSGKSTIGRLLAEKLGALFTDMDEVLMQRLGMPIAQYFAQNGEPAFRSAEAELAAELALKQGLVIATGGGIVKSRENMRRLAANGLIVWLDRSLELLEATSDRPLSQDRAALEKLWGQRRQLYEEYADIRVPADGAPEETVQELIRILSEERPC